MSHTFHYNYCLSDTNYLRFFSLRRKIAYAAVGTGRVCSPFVTSGSDVRLISYIFVVYSP